MEYLFSSCSKGESNYYKINGYIDTPIYVKDESLNHAGSIKLKTAVSMVDSLLKSGDIGPNTILIESSSGNLGIALSMICRAKNIPFICVTDKNASKQSIQTMKIMGAEVIVIDKVDANGGYLASRIEYIQNRLKSDKNLCWINQYENSGNWLAHYYSTAIELHSSFKGIDWLFIGAGTCGTLVGCAKYFKRHSPHTKIIGVDAEGSVTFGFSSKKRKIPGLGTSRVPPILDVSLVDDVILVSEEDTISMCWKLLNEGKLVGGSTGTVIAGILKYKDLIKPSDTVVTISPDNGFKYLDTIYSRDWLANNFAFEGNGDFMPGYKAQR